MITIDQQMAVRTNVVQMENEMRPLLRPIEMEAEAIEVVDQPSYDHAIAIAKKAVEMRKSITERLKPGKDSAYKSWQEWTKLEKDLLDAVTKAEKIAKSKATAWEIEQEQIRMEEQHRLEAEARKRVEEERLAAAVAAEQSGASKEEVEAILKEAEAPVVVMAPPTFQKAEGTSIRETWKSEVVNLQLLIQHVAKNPALMHLLQPNMTALNAMARAQKSMLNLPGVKAVREKTMAVRT